MPTRWTLEDIPWDEFDRWKVDPDTLAIVKAASMVERNAEDYAEYLSRVFSDDADFLAAAPDWAADEVQHGEALGKWATLADPDFDFAKAFAAFRRAYHAPEGFGLSAERTESNRGSRAAEMIYRCIVETGTSNFYTAIHDSTDEPVLKTLCKNIAADEFRHYALFDKILARHYELEKIGRLKRFRSAMRYTTEYRDDIVAYAYFAANGMPGPYNRQACGEAHERRALRLYHRPHAVRCAKMVLRAAGVSHHGRLAKVAGRLLYSRMRVRSRRLDRRALRRARKASHGRPDLL